jgi:ribosomal protection tetracycline resistance protein
MDNGYQKDLWLKTMQEMINACQLFPCTSGSALQDIGIDGFLEKLDQLTMTQYESNQAFSGTVYKIRHDQNGTRISFIKALSGSLKVRDELMYGNVEKSNIEKITQIRSYSGNKYITVDKVEAGELFAVTGLSMSEVGDGVGLIQEKSGYEMVPTLKSKVNFESTVNIREALQYFKQLDSEDPSLNVTWQEKFQDIHIHVMGKIQLEVLEQVVRERFQLRVTFTEPEILYKETISSEVIGYGHFEPLGHYAEVHLKIEPGTRNSGITFENKCHADDLSVGNQNLIKHHLFEKEHHGILTGSPITDVKVTLLTGRAHNKHTTGGDFREATIRALRQGLEKATNILLEPYYQYKIKVDIEQLGRVISDIQTAHGIFDTPTTEGNKAILTGAVPVATFLNYSSQLASFTQGKGSIQFVFAGYNQCHNKQEVINKIGYNKNADPEYSSSSIFCSKGQGYSVEWNEVEEKMHCI